MNRVILSGRLVRDPEIRSTQSSNPVTTARYSLAVPRRRKQDKENMTDFVNCVAFGQTADFAGRYLKQGTKILVQGRIQSGSYISKTTGQKVYTTEVLVEEQEFAESRREGNPAEKETEKQLENGKSEGNDPDLEFLSGEFADYLDADEDLMSTFARKGKSDGMSRLSLRKIRSLSGRRWRVFIREMLYL